MEKLTQVTSIPASLPDANIDTDIIFPARFLLITEKRGLGRYAFYEKRFDADGAARDDFVLNSEPWNKSSILITGDNFGCGSSREQAPWALYDLGIRCVVSTSFGEIFEANCLNNGILPVMVKQVELAALHEDAGCARELTADLVARALVRHDGTRIPIGLPEWQSQALLNGWDEIDRALKEDCEHTERFEIFQRETMSWLYDNETRHT